MEVLGFQDISLTTLLTAITVLLLTIAYLLHKRRGVLPGPTGFPYLGIFPILKYDTGHIQLAEYGKKYGDVFSFTYLGQLFIHLGSVKVIRDLHVNKSECFTDRFTTFNVLNYMIPDSVAMANGEMWKTHKKFFNQKFREYGLNSLREGLAGPIYDSLDLTMKVLKDARDKPINIVHLLSERCTVTLRRMIFGDNGISDEDLEAMITGYSSALEGTIGTAMLIMGPVGRFLLNISPSARKSLTAHDGVRDIVQASIKKIESAMRDDQPTCIIEEYLHERNEKRRQNDPVWKLYTDYALVSTISQFVGDGISGVASFISGILNSLIQHPDEQEKIYEEIIDVVGSSRPITLDDKAKLPYTNAYFNEVIRTSSFLPLFPSLECTKETTYRGHRIPKGAITVYNFHAIHNNPDTFEDPEAFNPSRYLSTPGKTKAELPTTFGMGKRSCSGEAFVMAQTFIFVATIVRHFKIVGTNVSKNELADFFVSGKLELKFHPRTEI